MSKYLSLHRTRRRSSTPHFEIATAESSIPITRPNSASGSRSHPSNRARKGRSRAVACDTVPPPTGYQPGRNNLSSILNSATQPPSPICAMDPAAEEILHICPVNNCDCRKSLTPMTRSAQIPHRINDLRIVLLVTSINSFTQLVYARLKERASPLGDVAVKIFYPGTKCTNGTSDLIAELVEFKTDVILCPFLTAKIPADLYKRFLTLVVHPGPPGDVGPSALDWTLCGDDGLEPDATVAMTALRNNSLPFNTRSHWGCIVFQADEEMDKGPIWAWEEYALPDETITKGYLYHFGHSPAAWNALDAALKRVVSTAVEANFYVQKVMVHDDVPTKEQLEELCDEDLDTIQQRVSSHSRLRVVEATQASLLWADQIAPQPSWATYPVSHHPKSDIIHSCGTLANRPLIKPADRKVDWDNWTAEKIVQFVSAFDSQPGAAFHPTTASTKKLYIYGAHLQHNAAPGNTWQHLYKNWQDIPNGTAVAVRAGAVFFKTEPEGSDAVGVWITHGRVLKPVGAPIEPKISLESALMDGGHGEMLAKAVEWPLDWTHYSKGDWQECYVHTQPHPLGVVQFVYWSFYNGAFTTEKCELLLRALMWAGNNDDQHVCALVLMGGHYFSNGIALNAIEHRGNAAPSPEDADRWAGEETWANINAIDDIVEYLAGDTETTRSTIFADKPTLCQKGIPTIAVMRGNAAAGGVALAAACDIVVAAENTVLNPAYRGMGLHGSEFHSWSYRTRCGDEMAAKLLRDMLPMTATAASKIGLVDIVYTREHDISFPPIRGPDLQAEKTIALMIWPDVALRTAPWCEYRSDDGEEIPTTLQTICQNKVDYFARNRADFSLPPLIHFRYEELSQMLLDCHHPKRSQRYHTRRRNFIRKTKCGKTPSRYAPAIKGLIKDEEHFIEFDATGEWERGSEWPKFLEEVTPPMLKFSAWTRVILLPEQEMIIGRDGYKYEGRLNNFDRMLQRVALCCTADLSLDFQGLVDRLVKITSQNPEALVVPFDGPSSHRSHTYFNWIWPQLGSLREQIFALKDHERAVEAAEAAAALAAAQAESEEDDQDLETLDPYNAEAASIAPRQSLQLPLVRSSSSVDMNSFPSSDTALGTPPRLPFSRSASPIPGDMDHLGSAMLEELIRSFHVEPPKPQSRRYSRLNTGNPDLLIRAAGPSGRIRQPTN